jgi:hypothetical protein
MIRWLIFCIVVTFALFGFIVFTWFSVIAAGLYFLPTVIRIFWG